MAKKVEVMPAETTVASSVDLRITKNDIIELMLEEEEQRLEAVQKEAQRALDDLRKKEWDAAFVRLKKSAAKAIADLQRIYPSAVWYESDGYYNKRGLILKNHQDDSDNRALVSLNIYLSKEAEERIGVAQQAVNDAHNAKVAFHSQAKKGRVAMTRKLLEQSEEGKAILAQAGAVGKLLVGAK